MASAAVPSPSAGGGAPSLLARWRMSLGHVDQRAETIRRLSDFALTHGEPHADLFLQAVVAHMRFAPRSLVPSLWLVDCIVQRCAQHRAKRRSPFVGAAMAHLAAIADLFIREGRHLPALSKVLQIWGRLQIFPRGHLTAVKAILKLHGMAGADADVGAAAAAAAAAAGESKGSGGGRRSVGLKRPAMGIGGASNDMELAAMTMTGSTSPMLAPRPGAAKRARLQPSSSSSLLGPGPTGLSLSASTGTSGTGADSKERESTAMDFSEDFADMWEEDDTAWSAEQEQRQQQVQVQELERKRRLEELNKRWTVEQRTRQRQQQQQLEQAQKVFAQQRQSPRAGGATTGINSGTGAGAAVHNPSERHVAEPQLFSAEMLARKLQAHTATTTSTSTTTTASPQTLGSRGRGRASSYTATTTTTMPSGTSASAMPPPPPPPPTPLTHGLGRGLGGKSMQHMAAQNQRLRAPSPRGTMTATPANTPRGRHHGKGGGFDTSSAFQHVGFGGSWSSAEKGTRTVGRGGYVVPMSPALSSWPGHGNLHSGGGAGAGPGPSPLRAPPPTPDVHNSGSYLQQQQQLQQQLLQQQLQQGQQLRTQQQQRAQHRQPRGQLAPPPSPQIHTTKKNLSDAAAFARLINQKLLGSLPPPGGALPLPSPSPSSSSSSSSTSSSGMSVVGALVRQQQRAQQTRHPRRAALPPPSPVLRQPWHPAQHLLPLHDARGSVSLAQAHARRAAALGSSRSGLSPGFNMSPGVHTSVGSGSGPGTPTGSNSSMMTTTKSRSRLSPYPAATAHAGGGASPSPIPFSLSSSSTSSTLHTTMPPPPSPAWGAQAAQTMAHQHHHGGGSAGPDAMMLSEPAMPPRSSPVTHTGTGAFPRDIAMYSPSIHGHGGGATSTYHAANSLYGHRGVSTPVGSATPGLSNLMQQVGVRTPTNHSSGGHRTTSPWG